MVLEGGDGDMEAVVPGYEDEIKPQLQRMPARARQKEQEKLRIMEDEQKPLEDLQESIVQPPPLVPRRCSRRVDLAPLRTGKKKDWDQESDTLGKEWEMSSLEATPVSMKAPSRGLSTRIRQVLRRSSGTGKRVSQAPTFETQEEDENVADTEPDEEQPDDLSGFNPDFKKTAGYSELSTPDYKQEEAIHQSEPEAADAAIAKKTHISRRHQVLTESSKRDSDTLEALKKNIGNVPRLRTKFDQSKE